MSADSGNGRSARTAPSAEISPEARELRSILRQFSQENALMHYVRVAACGVGLVLIAFWLWWTPAPAKAPPADAAATSSSRTTWRESPKSQNLLFFFGVSLVIGGLFSWKASLERRALLALMRAEVKRSDPDWNGE